MMSGLRTGCSRIQHRQDDRCEHDHLQQDHRRGERRVTEHVHGHGKADVVGIDVAGRGRPDDGFGQGALPENAGDEEVDGDRRNRGDGRHSDDAREEFVHIRLRQHCEQQAR
jgi:hypothetical protein